MNCTFKHIIKWIKQFLKDPAYKFVQIALRFVSENRIPDRVFIKYKFHQTLGYPLNLGNPQTACEKFQWLKLHDHNPLYHKLVDKYEVKQYVAERIGYEHVVKTIGVYNRFEDINFAALPKQFVIKCTHDSGSVMVCRDKSNFDTVAAAKHFCRMLNNNHYAMAREWAYKDIKPRILVEEYIDSLGNPNSVEYKITCLYGKVSIITVCSGIAHVEFEKRFNDHYDINGNKLPFWIAYKPAGKPLPPKHELDEMIAVCEKLSSGIPQVRIDLYRHKGILYFGEFTFYTWAGLMQFHPLEYDRILGDMFELPITKK